MSFFLIELHYAFSFQKSIPLQNEKREYDTISFIQKIDNSQEGK